MWVFGELNQGSESSLRRRKLSFNLGFKVIDSMESSIEKHRQASSHVSVHSFIHSFISLVNMYWALIVH